MGILSGSIPWVTMMILHKKCSLLQQVSFTFLKLFYFLTIASFVKKKKTHVICAIHLMLIEA